MNIHAIVISNKSKLSFKMKKIP